MAGSGTGTPATGSATPTLNDIRDRIRTQLEAAAGLAEPLVINASNIKLAGLRRRVKAQLQDLSSTGTWANEDIDEAIRSALERFSGYKPRHALGTLVLPSDGREIDISSLTDAVSVEKVWWDYDSSNPAFPPNYRQFEIWPNKILYIDDRTEPQTGDTVRIWYTTRHTLNGLDGRSVTTIPEGDEGTIVTGATHYATLARSVELAERLTMHSDVSKNLRAYAEQQEKSFRYQARADMALYLQRAKAYEQNDIDEAVRWALHRITGVSPHRAITALTLAADGREIDASSLTYSSIERIWARYDSTAPDPNPAWCDFEVWAGDIIFIKDPIEPLTGDIFRVWYTDSHALNGLDGASLTTLTEPEVTTLIVGATGYCTQERIQEKEHWWGNRDLRDWADARLREFEAALVRMGRREAARHSGIATTPKLDRWDDGGWS